jgi:hypothetical protein
MAVMSRKGQEVEVLDPYPRVVVPLPEEEAWAHPVPSRARDIQPQIHVREEHVHHHHAPLAAPAPSVRWRMLGAYVFGLAMLLVVLGLLLASGVIDLHALRPPWQETGR